MDVAMDVLGSIRVDVTEILACEMAEGPRLPTGEGVERALASRLP
jgi:hypothetical protein